MTQTGIVLLVGAGPGDPKLLTIRAMEEIQQADVIVYDRLVNKEILRYAKQKVELIYCGKMPNNHLIPQEQINEMLVTQAKKGKRVVRLKGGDPCIFGRGGEEAEYCFDNGVAFELVPGITSGIAAPMYAGIPVTHRDFSSSLTIVTGHKRSGNVDELRWEHLANGSDTLIFYMGVSNLAIITAKLMEYGRSETTPVAIVQQGTTMQQKTMVGTLSTIVEIAQQEKAVSPSIIVVGDVVLLREKLTWFEKDVIHFNEREMNIS